MNFDENVMKLSGEEFVDNIIVNQLNAALVSVGFDYRFGHKAMGNSSYLKELGAKKKVLKLILSNLFPLEMK